MWKWPTNLGQGNRLATLLDYQLLLNTKIRIINFSVAEYATLAIFSPVMVLLTQSRVQVTILVAQDLMSRINEISVESSSGFARGGLIPRRQTPEGTTQLDGAKASLIFDQKLPQIMRFDYASYFYFFFIFFFCVGVCEPYSFPWSLI